MAFGMLKELSPQDFLPCYLPCLAAVERVHNSDKSHPQAQHYLTIMETVQLNSVGKTLSKFFLAW
jgi:hypothetical protein